MKCLTKCSRLLFELMILYGPRMTLEIPTGPLARRKVPHPWLETKVFS